MSKKNRTVIAVNITRRRQICWHARRHSENHHYSWSTKVRGGWRGMEEQSLTVQRKAEVDQMVLYTLLWWPLPCSAIQYCILAFDSITKTHKRGHTHKHTQHSETGDRHNKIWYGKQVKKIKKSFTEFLVSLVISQTEAVRYELISQIIHTENYNNKKKRDMWSQFTQHQCKTNKSYWYTGHKTYHSLRHKALIHTGQYSVIFMLSCIIRARDEF